MSGGQIWIQSNEPRIHSCLEFEFSAVVKSAAYMRQDTDRPYHHQHETTIASESLKSLRSHHYPRRNQLDPFATNGEADDLFQGIFSGSGKLPTRTPS